VASAAAVTCTIELETTCEPRAASCTLREISAVAAPCSSTAVAISAAVPWIARIASPMARMSPPACCVADWISPI
ncbi:MAG: hypothetical protein ACK5U4_16505, partial [Rhodospirillales bacterium]